MDKNITIQNKKMKATIDTSNIYECREVFAKMSSNAREVKSEVTVMVCNYNQLEKSKRCIESVLKYTQDVDYELILIDNGSEPEILEYLKSVEHPKKTIIRLEENTGAAFPYENIPMSMLSEYVVLLANDIIVTKNWLSNILKVFESDKKIGLVNVVSSNASNLQQVELGYKTYEEMQEKAEAFNVSNPSKWQERLRIITLGATYRKECLYAIGWPVADVGFGHDFGDDDLAFRVRRMGYKVVLAGDTWICHDHQIREKDPGALHKSLERGRADFQQKYYGIDAWDDVNNYIYVKFGNKIKKCGSMCPNILGIDVKCGTPILDIKNEIRKYGIYDAELSAFTRDEKYVADLNTICDGIVACGQEEMITRKLLYNNYDYIIIDRPLNAYHEPMSVLMDAYMLLKKDGQLVFSLKNTNDVTALLAMFGVMVKTNDEYCYNYTVDNLAKDLSDMQIKYSFIGNEVVKNVNNQLADQAKKILEAHCDVKALDEMRARLMIDRYWLSIEK